MKKASKHLPPLRLPSIFNTLEQNEPLEILAASLVACHMLWPEYKEERSRSLYMTLCLRKIHDFLIETEPKHGDEIFRSIVTVYFGGISQYTQNLVSVNFPSNGKGSIAERAWQGELAGSVFLYAFQNEASLNDAAKAVSDMLRNNQAEELADMLKPAPENIMKNYWPRFQHVAHFWAAMQCFVMPEPTDSIIRLDKVVPSPAINPSPRHGWRGVVDVAHHFLELSADVKRFKTHKPLLDRETAFRVLFME